MRLRQNRHLLHSNFLIVSDPSIHFFMLLESKSPVSKVATALENPGFTHTRHPKCLVTTCMYHISYVWGDHVEHLRIVLCHD